MSSTGQIVGGIAGAVIGGYLGGNVGGAYMGFSLGMLIGSALDPPRGERLAPDYSRSDAQYNAVGRNIPVPIVYGVNRVGGQLIWLAPHGTRIIGSDGKKEGGSGGGGGGGSKKGGSDTGQRAVMDMDWAVALSEGQITIVSGVFLGDKIAEISDGMEYTAYLGTPEQTADPRIANDLGPLAPAFRNLAYIALSAELESPNLPTVTAELSGVLGTPVIRNQTRYPLGYNAFAGDALEMSDGSLLALTHAGEELYRSTDRGETWTHVGCGIAGITGAIANAALGDHPGVAGRAYAAIYTYPMGNVRVYRSDDYGATWPNTSAPMAEAWDAGTVVGVRDDPNGVLFFDRGVGPYGYAAHAWRSDDGGDTFSITHQITTHLGWFGGVVATVQPRPGTVYGMGGGMGGQAMLHSEDGGRSWDETEIEVYSPVQGSGWCYNELIFGFGCNTSSGGAVYLTNDGGKTWGGFKVCDDAIGGMKMNSFGLLVAATSGTAWYSTTLGVTWQHLRVPTLAAPVIIPWGGPTCMWLTNDQVCFGGGSPAYVTCVDLTVPTSCGNPALIVRDLLTNRRYGLGLDPDLRIDDTSFIEASAYCIAQVPSRLSSGHVEQRFCLDYVVDQQQTVLDHLRDMLATFGGYLCWSQGRVKLKVDQPTSCCQSFGMGEIIANSFQWRKHSYRNRVNVVHVDFVDPGNTVYYANPEDATLVRQYISDVGGATLVNPNKNYKTYKHDFVEASDQWDIDRTGERRERVINLVGIKRRSQAQRMAEYYLAKAVHCQHTCTFRVGIGALKAETGDVIAVTHDIPKWAGKLFRIVEIQEAANDELTLGCLEYNEAVFRAVPGVRPWQDTITGRETSLLDPPFHVGRLTAYERPFEDMIEINYTRLASQDLFGGVYLYKRVGEDGPWLRQNAKLSLAPTAYLTSHLHTVTLVQS